MANNEITDSNIEALATEAGAHGDSEQVLLCEARARHPRGPREGSRMSPEIEAARNEFLAACEEVGTDPIEFENAVLGIGREFLPPAALQVLDDGPATVEYWQWLENEVAAGSAGQS